MVSRLEQMKKLRQQGKKDAPDLPEPVEPDALPAARRDKGRSKPDPAPGESTTEFIATIDSLLAETRREAPQDDASSSAATEAADKAPSVTGELRELESFAAAVHRGESLARPAKPTEPARAPAAGPSESVFSRAPAIPVPPPTVPLPLPSTEQLIERVVAPLKEQFELLKNELEDMGKGFTGVVGEDNTIDRTNLPVRIAKLEKGQTLLFKQMGELKASVNSVTEALKSLRALLFKKDEEKLINADLKDQDIGLIAYLLDKGDKVDNVDAALNKVDKVDTALTTLLGDRYQCAQGVSDIYFEITWRALIPMLVAPDFKLEAMKNESTRRGPDMVKACLDHLVRNPNEIIPEMSKKIFGSYERYTEIKKAIESGQPVAEEIKKDAQSFNMASRIATERIRVWLDLYNDPNFAKKSPQGGDV